MFREKLSKFLTNCQLYLFPILNKDIGELSEDHKKLVSILELIRIEEFVPCTRFNLGRPNKHREAIARSYIAKIVFQIPQTKQLLTYLKNDEKLRHICGWDSLTKLPSEATFSRAFAEFSNISLPEITHNFMIKEIYKDQVVGHVVKDSTSLEARERSLKKGSAKERKKLRDKQKKERKKTGELNRRQKQLQEESLEKMINELPKVCDKGMKKSAQGYTYIWKGYKLHMAVDDHCVPLAAILTSASLNDCEAAIPLACKTNLVVTYFYDLMDAAYDHPEIKAHSIASGHVPIIDFCPTNQEQKFEKELEKNKRKILNFTTAERQRYNERFPKERVNALYKDFHGGRTILYKGYPKISCHVMFGILVLAASTLISLVQ